jgi:hypothetical protein
MRGTAVTAVRLFLRRLRYGLVSGLLLVALFLLNTLAGCESAKDPIPLYGPPPDVVEGEDGLFLDVLSPADLEDDDQIVYGPPPVDAITDIPNSEDVLDVMQPPPPYGPPPMDVLEDTPSWDTLDVMQPPPPYGPMPVDTIQDTWPSAD